MSHPAYGRYQAPDTPHALLSLHVHDPATPLKEVDHEPKLSVLDQSDLLTQRIRVSSFIPGAKDVDALGSCTANATTVGLSNVLPATVFTQYVTSLGKCQISGSVYDDVKSGERAAIGFYHACTDQTGNPATEWPPTDCGSSGPYIVNELQALQLITGQRIAHGAQNLVSLLQTDGILMGSPWFYAWEDPDASGFIDGKGTFADLQAAIQSGVAGGHETYLDAIEQLIIDPHGRVVPEQTVIRGRNSWSASWGDHGCYRIHLSTLVALGGYCDFRQLVA